MKKIIILLIFTISITSVFSQIQIDGYGNVSFKFYDGAPYDTKAVLKMDADYNNEVCLRPYATVTGSLGKSNKKWRYIYTQNLIVNGSAVTGSDRKLKTNIRDIGNVLPELMKVVPVKYDLSEEAFKGVTGNELKHLLDESKNKFGFIAQDLKEIFPDLVVYNEKQDLYGVKYVEMIPLLLQGIKEQQQQIDEIKTQINECCINNNIEKSAAKSTTAIEDKTLLNARLYQNKPNPFTSGTNIEYFVPEGATKACIIIYDMQGAQLKAFNIKSTGLGNISISSDEIKPGMYMYSLIIDEKEISTLKMILTSK